MKINDLPQNDAAKRLRHGRVTATLVSKKTGDHITIRVRCRNKKLKGFINLEHAAILTADVPSSRSEDGSYTSSGDRVGWYHPFKGWRPNRGADTKRYWALETLWKWITTGESHPQVEIGLEDHCGRCGRPLNDPESKRRGLGPDCYGELTGSHHVQRGEVIDDPQLLGV